MDVETRQVRVTAAVVAGLMTAAVMVAPAAQATNAPGFGLGTVRLPGAAGRSEPRATLPGAWQYVDTNDMNGTSVVYRSHDGVHWALTEGVPSGQVVPTTDVDLVSTRTGRLISSELDSFGLNFKTAYSDDRGRTWTPSTGTTFVDNDRQWLAVGPDDPTTHQPRVYLLFHNLLSGLASHNMFVATSTDGGATFGLPVPITLPGQQDWLDLQCADSGGPSNIVVDQHSGRVFAVFGSRSSVVGGCGAQPVEVNVVAANRVWVVEAPASGVTNPTAWRGHLAVDDTGPPAHIVGMQLAPGAVDTAGNVYVVYPESTHDYPDYRGAAIKVVHALASNLDRWSTPSTIAGSGGPGNVLPHIVAGAPGRLDVAFYHGVPAAGGTVDWYSEAAQSLNAMSTHPTWTTVRLSPVLAEPPTQDASQLMGACLKGTLATLNGFACGRAADVYGIALDRCGRLLVTWPAQAGLKTDGTYVSEQVSGPRLLAC